MKKENIKKIAAIISVVALAVSCISGCGKNAGKDDDGKITISIADCPDETTNPEAYKNMVETIEAFEKKYPDVNVEMDTWTFDVQTYMAKAEGGTLPTTYYVPLTEAKNIMDLGYAADITDEFIARGFYDNVNDFILENISRDDKIYFFPTGCYDMGLIVNIDILKDAGYVNEDGTPHEPQTWEEMAEMAVKIKETTGKNGFIIPTVNNCGGWRFTPIAWSYGVEFMKQNKSGDWKATFDSPECVEALQFIKDLKWKYDIFPANTLVDMGEVQKQMGTGECAMTIAEVNQIHSFTQFGMNPGSVGAVRIPGGPERRVSLMGGGYNVIDKSATPEQIKAVFDWMEFNGYTMKLNDAVKASVQNGIENAKELNQVIGVATLSPWKSENEVQKYQREQEAKNANINMNQIKLYNDKTGVEYQAEEPIEAQALYAVLDSCIQEVLNNKKADCAALIKKAAEDFQKNHLDYAE